MSYSAEKYNLTDEYEQNQSVKSKFTTMDKFELILQLFFAAIFAINVLTIFNNYNCRQLTNTNIFKACKSDNVQI